MSPKEEAAQKYLETMKEFVTGTRRLKAIFPQAEAGDRQLREECLDLAKRMRGLEERLSQLSQVLLMLGVKECPGCPVCKPEMFAEDLLAREQSEAEKNAYEARMNEPYELSAKEQARARFIKYLLRVGKISEL